VCYSITVCDGGTSLDFGTSGVEALRALVLLSSAFAIFTGVFFSIIGSSLSLGADFSLMVSKIHWSASSFSLIGSFDSLPLTLHFHLVHFHPQNLVLQPLAATFVVFQ
jgi:hypothetical protein